MLRRSVAMPPGADEPAQPASRRRRSGRQRLARRATLRRLAAAMLTGVTVFLALSAMVPKPMAGGVAPTVIASRVVPAGAVLTTDDLDVVEMANEHRPATSLTASAQAVGRGVASPIDQGEVLTPARLLGSNLLAGQPPDRVAMSVPVIEAPAAGVHPGTHVDLWATGTGATAASDVVVLAVSAPDASAAWGAAPPSRLTLALDPREASAVARHLSVLGGGESFVVAVRRPTGAGQ